MDSGGERHPFASSKGRGGASGVKKDALTEPRKLKVLSKNIGAKSGKGRMEEGRRKKRGCALGGRRTGELES